MNHDYYIGIMSGTSLDGIDAGIYDFNQSKMQSIAFHYQAYPTAIKKKIKQFCDMSQTVSLQDYGELEQQLSELYAKACLALLAKTSLSAKHIKAIGSHGQTLCHFPNSQHPFSLQIGDANIIAQRTKITTVADFRSRDIAAGGQGAPLVPAFHQAIFHSDLENRAILNIGGIANLTLLPKNTQQAVQGFDTGVGNTLMDSWIHQHLKQAYDKNGDWAKTGTVQADLLHALKADAYFKQPLPKSTGTEYFSKAWLMAKLSPFHYQPEDIQRTLCQFTAETIAEALLKFAPTTDTLFICGGGIHNQCLMDSLKNLLPISIKSTKDIGVDPDQVEAMAFAWLAKQTLKGLTSNLPSVTGAKQAVILGGIYQA